MKLHRIFHSYLLTALAISFTSCSGGISCPFTPPSCCENALFGCGPFDLPQGCSCNDYFSRSFSGGAKSTPARPPRSRKTPRDETWRITLRKTSGSCPYLANQVTGTVLIRSAGNLVQVRPIGYPTLRGTRSRKLLRVRGTQTIGFAGCKAAISGALSQVSSSGGDVSASIDLACRTQVLSCQATFSGQARKVK